MRKKTKGHYLRTWLVIVAPYRDLFCKFRTFLLQEALSKNDSPTVNALYGALLRYSRDQCILSNAVWMSDILLNGPGVSSVILTNKHCFMAYCLEFFSRIRIGSFLPTHV